MIRLSENGINRKNRHERLTPVPVFLRSRSGMRLKRKNAVLVILPLPVDYTAPKVLIYKELEGCSSQALSYGLIGDFSLGNAGDHI